MLVQTPLNSRFFFLSLYFSLHLCRDCFTINGTFPNANIPFAVHIQQFKKQQVSNCCVLKSIVKNDEKKSDEN